MRIKKRMGYKDVKKLVTAAQAELDIYLARER